MLDRFDQPDVTSTWELKYLDYVPGWFVQEKRQTPNGLTLWKASVPLGDFLLEQTSSPTFQNGVVLAAAATEYTSAATPLEAAQLLAMERILTRTSPLEQAAAFRDAGTHPYSPADVDRLAASTLSRDVENFLDGLGHVLQPDEVDALADYLLDRG